MITHRTCTGCKINKPVSEFHLGGRGKTGSPRYKNHCKICRRGPNPQRAYALTKVEYDSLLASQDGKCALCGTTYVGRQRHTLFCIDHNHTTGKVRGLLCNPCNLLIGWVENTGVSGNQIETYLTGSLVS